MNPINRVTIDHPLAASVAEALHDAGRLAVVRELEALHSAAAATLDRIVRLVAHALDVPVALITLVDPERQRLMGLTGLGEPWATDRETPLSHSICQYVVALGEPLAVADARENPITAHSLAIRELDVIAYAGVPLRLEGGQVVGAVCAIDHVPRAWHAHDLAVLNDVAVLVVEELGKQRRIVSARIQAEHEVAAIQRLETFGKLVGGTAHDLNNMLLAVLGYADLALLDLEPSTAAFKGVEKVTRAARHAADLAQRMVAHVRAGNAHVEAFDLADLLDEVVYLMGAAIPATIRIERRGDARDGWLVADKTQIRQVVMNLVLNAAEAIGEAVGTITLTVSSQVAAPTTWKLPPTQAPDASGHFVVLEVTDTGCGMDARTAERIFDPFFTTKVHGSGIGLPTVLSILRRHGAGIHVESQPGAGTTFSLCFPCEAVELSTRE